MEIRIEGFDLPGRTCAAGPGFPGYTDIHVAVQRRRRPGELLDPQPGDAEAVAWALECTATRTPSGTDLKGPDIHGGPGGRFVYLSWGTVDEVGFFTVFRRAKLMFDAIDPATIDAATQGGRLLARLRLTDAKGHPVCAAVRPPLIEWTAARIEDVG